MFYDPVKADHGLPHNPFYAIVSPRPIGWISTRSASGQDNLAPYSFFNAVQLNPPMVMFSSGATKLNTGVEKDSIVNIRETGDFCVNIVSEDLLGSMNETGAHFDHGVDEFEQAGLDKSQGKLVNAAYVTDSPASLECKLYSITELPGGSIMVLGTVVGIHIRDEYIVDGLLDVTKYKPASRLGYKDYSIVRDVFPLDRPK